MKSLLLSILLALILPFTGIGQIQLRYDKNETLAYDEIIQAYKDLDQTYENAKLFEIGPTDIGRPLHLFVISTDADFDPKSLHLKDRTIVFIINGIHPGEPPGVDASIKFAEEILSGYKKMDQYLEHVVLCIVPVYNVGGLMNRSAYNRANADTPVETGFRGNARNLDLNRDFIKLDSKNARSLVKAISYWDPEIVLDTHVTNGSDHQYVITLIPTVHQRLPQYMSDFFKDSMVPDLFKRMKASPYEMIPYVNWITRDPSKGIASYFDAPRVSSGYASLSNRYSFMTENHVYKEYKDQVQSVYYFLDALVSFSYENHVAINESKRKADEFSKNQIEMVSAWRLDTSRYDIIEFKGFETFREKSPLTGAESMYYDRERPYIKEIKYYQYFKEISTITKPDYYIIPQAWDKAIESLELNGVEMTELSEDMEVEVETYYLEQATYAKRPNNGHFRNSQIKVRSEKQKVLFRKGDYLVKMDQTKNRFIMEVLEPTTIDSYLSWNFFDPIFDRREYFSPYGFEKKAFRYLESHPDLKEAFQDKKASDPDFAKSHYAQLQYIYNNSPFYEQSYMRYPVYRFFGEF